MNRKLFLRTICATLALVLGIGPTGCVKRQISMSAEEATRVIADQDKVAVPSLTEPGAYVLPGGGTTTTVPSGMPVYQATPISK